MSNPGFIKTENVPDSSSNAESGSSNNEETGSLQTFTLFGKPSQDRIRAAWSKCVEKHKAREALEAQLAAAINEERAADLEFDHELFKHDCNQAKRALAAAEDNYVAKRRRFDTAVTQSTAVSDVFQELLMVERDCQEELETAETSWRSAKRTVEEIESLQASSTAE